MRDCFIALVSGILIGFFFFAPSKQSPKSHSLKKTVLLNKRSLNHFDKKAYVKNSSLPKTKAQKPLTPTKTFKKKSFKKFKKRQRLTQKPHFQKKQKTGEAQIANESDSKETKRKENKKENQTDTVSKDKEKQKKPLLYEGKDKKKEESFLEKSYTFSSSPFRNKNPTSPPSSPSRLLTPILEQRKEKPLSFWIENIVEKESEKTLHEFLDLFQESKIKDSVFKSVLESMLEKEAFFQKSLDILGKNPSSLSFEILIEHTEKSLEDNDNKNVKTLVDSYLEPHKIHYLIETLSQGTLSSNITSKALGLLSEKQDQLKDLNDDIKTNLFITLSSLFKDEYKRNPSKDSEPSDIEQENYDLTEDLIAFLEPSQTV